MPKDDAGVDPLDPALHNRNLVGNNPKHRSGDRRHPRIRLIGNDGDEIVDAMDALGGDNPKFRQMGPQRIDPASCAAGPAKSMA
jgi:hypothetical protein